MVKRSNAAAVEEHKDESKNDMFYNMDELAEILGVVPVEAPKPADGPNVHPFQAKGHHALATGTPQNQMINSTHKNVPQRKSIPVAAEALQSLQHPTSAKQKKNMQNFFVKMVEAQGGGATLSKQQPTQFAQQEPPMVPTMPLHAQQPNSMVVQPSSSRRK